MLLYNVWFEELAASFSSSYLGWGGRFGGVCHCQKRFNISLEIYTLH